MQTAPGPDIRWRKLPEPILISMGSTELWTGLQKMLRMIHIEQTSKYLKHASLAHWSSGNTKIQTLHQKSSSNARTQQRPSQSRSYRLSWKMSKSHD